MFVQVFQGGVKDPDGLRASLDRLITDFSPQADGWLGTTWGLYGDKEFTLYPPGQEHLLYVDPDLPWQSLVRNHHAPDYARYPLLRRARSQKVVIRTGETLFLPCGWWHTARSLSLTISVAFDQLGPDNWPDFIADVVAQRCRAGKPLKALLLGVYLRLLGPVFAVAERFGANRRVGWGNR